MALARRTAATIALVAALSVTLTGCLPLPPSTWGGTQGQGTGSQPQGGVPYDYQPTGEDVAPELQQYYGQDVDWQACGAMTCGTIAAPMNWFNAGDGRSIEVAMAIRPADGERRGAMLYNPGGPGASGIDYVTNYAQYLVAPEVLEHYDLVGFDPRGVGKSTPITCYDDPKWLYNWIYEIPAGPQPEPLSDADLDQQRANGQAFAQACLTYTGEALEFMGTEQAASDMDLMRALLGEEKLQYLGVSYGTLLGATYADLFPENVGRFVLDAAVAPDSTDQEGSLFQAGGFELALKNFSEDCLSRVDCPLQGTTDEAMQSVRALLDQLDAAPLQASDGRQLGSSSMFTAIAANLYSESSWSTLRRVFADVMAGKAESAFSSADGYYGVNPDGTFADNSLEALIAINCLDYPPVTDYNEVRANAQEIEAAAPVLGRDFVGLSTCASWPFAATRTPHEVRAPGADPIIVIGGLNDPATPYGWSERLANQLESGVLITVNAQGHSQYNSGNRCVDEPVNEYFLTGTAITGPISC